MEDVNKLFKCILKKKLGAKKGDWSELLPEVLWAHHCTECTSIKETPYYLTFRVEAVILVEIGVPTHQVDHYTLETNAKQLTLSMDLLEEHRLHVAVYVIAYQ